MKITFDEYEKLDNEAIKEMIRNAVKREDKEFIMSIIPFYDNGGLEEDDLYLELNESILSDRDILLEMARNGHHLPKDLVENDQELVLEVTKSDFIYRY